MDKAFAAAALGVALCALCGVLWIAQDADNASIESDIQALGDEVRSIARGLEELRKETASARDESRQLAARIEKLRSAAAGGGGDAAPAPAVAAVERNEDASEDDEVALLDEFEELRAKVLGDSDTPATQEEQQRFWELARTSGALGQIIEELEAALAESPEDTELKLDLARGYVAKLLTVPNGPERGVWAMKAEGQWQGVLQLDPENWEAGYSLAFSWSQYPDFLGKTPDAIAGFEKVRTIQEARPVEPFQKQTYLQLSRLYLKQGDTAKARATLDAGLTRHPDDGDLAKARGSLPTAEEGEDGD